MKRSSLWLLHLSLLGLSTLAAGATQGSLGQTSTGDVNISLTIPPRVEISKLQDIALEVDAARDAVSGSTSACVYSNASGGGYHVKVRGNGVGGARAKHGSQFIVSDEQTGEQLQYHSFWQHDGMVTELKPNQATSTQQGADRLSTDCSDVGGSNAEFKVKFDADTLSDAKPGKYQGTAFITVSPN